VGGSDPLLPHLKEHLDQADAVDIAVAFTLESGLQHLFEHFRDLLRRGGRLRFLTGDYLDVTEPAALVRLLDLQSDVHIRVFETRGETSFHPKAYIFREKRCGFAFVGSSNLSSLALSEGIEWNLSLSSRTHPAGFVQVLQAFDELFTHPQTRPLDENWVDTYVLRRTLPDKKIIFEVGGSVEDVATPQPHQIQQEALRALEQTRTAGNTAGLVVLATGLGKTWLSAFDSFGPDYRRVLFVAHREEILGQAMATYRRIRPRATIGKYTGDEKAPNSDVLFASVQTLGRSYHLKQFARDAFDYIVIDEFHHAAARTYRNLIDYFTPKFLLGLTATPERTDGGDLLALCQENLVYRCDIADGISKSLLIPFHYFGIPDLVDYTNIPWRSSRFDEEALTNAVATRSRAENALQQYRKHAGTRTLAFCCSQRHADFMTGFFRDNELRSVAVHSGPSSAPRAASLEQLESGALDILCSVDMFNEGVDMPAVDTIMMLRPTESRILFLQQLGRGLRLSPHKQKLVVIDYIGNHRSFLIKPRALLGIGDTDVELSAALDRLRNGGINLPNGCEITYELEAIDILRELLRTRAGDDLIKTYYTDFRERYNQRPTATEAFHDGYNPRSLTPSYGSWLRFVRRMGDFTPGQETAFSSAKEFLDSLEITPMTKSFKMLTLLALLNEDSLPGEIAISDLATSFARIAARSPKFKNELGVDQNDLVAITKLLEQNPIAAWIGGRGTGGVQYFNYEHGKFRSVIQIPPEARGAFQELVREIIDWRLAQYLERGNEEQDGASGFIAKVSDAGGHPIIFLPDRTRISGVPLGDTPLTIEGDKYHGRFVKIAVNVIRREGSDKNELPRILHNWFGNDAGRPGTSHEVSFVPSDKEGVWTMSPAKRSRKGHDPELWGHYTREEIPPLFGFEFKTAIWTSGFVKLPGHLFLLVTLEKGGLDKSFKYQDKFLSPDTFQWQSQNRTTQKSAHGEAIRNHSDQGLAVHLFVRRDKRLGGGEAAPFVYCGDLHFESWSGNLPITVRWKLQTPVPNTLWDSLGVETKTPSLS
jgi:superfamily II DNA or RNA helicase/HKD family nuclease